MRRRERDLANSRSGQLLIVAALAIALIISSTTLYVYEVSKEEGTTSSYRTSDLILALKQGSRNAIVSSLANVSNAGGRAVLAESLSELDRSLRCLTRSGLCSLTFTLYNASGYDSGIKLLWNTTGVDVSSAYANLALNVIGIESRTKSQYDINVTTEFRVNGSYLLTGLEKHVSLTCLVSNEGALALAESVTVFFENGGNWTKVDGANALLIVDKGDGTYVLSFAVPSEVAQLSVHCLDLRGILVKSKFMIP